MVSQLIGGNNLDWPRKYQWCDDVDRWMLFVDGENVTIQAQKIAKGKGIDLEQGDHYEKDCFIWPVGMFHPQIVGFLNMPKRSYYYTSVVGDDEKSLDIKERLWKIGFDPQVFKKEKKRPAKAVDITLAKDVLCHAFRDNYDVAVLVAGDSDYLPLIEEVKRLGKLVLLAFHSDTTIYPELIIAADFFKGIVFDCSLPPSARDDQGSIHT